jgi:lysophospholipase L1-like esterase
MDYPWPPGVQPVEKIMALNSWIKDYAAQHQLTYLDYFPPMEESRHGMKAELTYDGVHPNAAGYAIMQKLATQAILKTLGQSIP